MLKKFLKPLIIGALQVLLLLILAAFFAPLFLKNATTVNHLKHLLEDYKGCFLIVHGLFYIALYFLWPLLIQYLAQRQTTPPTAEQLKKALNARLYLLAFFILFELLHLLG